jgi:hypothetical protein
MSIFKDTLKKELQEQLNVRQTSLVERTPSAIQYYNARNAWIRMSSAVNVKGSNELASKHVLQGGVLYNGNTARVGVGVGDQAYSLNNQSGVENRLGIRPMPGITGIEVKSKSAYGSLREVTVSFVAWDIRQLEDLELLYMRPGYTVLIEWGWTPYLNNEKKLSNNIQFYDIINPPQGLTKETIFKDLYNNAVEEYDGNYDAMYGYVKNYSWSAREDGGYDCTTEVISVGEVMESLKVNYAPFNNIGNIEQSGLIAPRISDISLPSDFKKNLKLYYSKNILAGLFYELYTIGNLKMSGTQDKGANFTIIDNVRGNTVYYDLFKKTLDIVGGDGEAGGTGKIGASDEQIYITLEGLCNLFNSHVTFIDSNSNTSYVNCSVLDRQYVTNNSTVNPLTGEGYLLCLAHPLQLSVDPTICTIKSPVWANGFKVNTDTIIPSGTSGDNLITFPSKLSDIQLDSVLDQLYYISIPTKTIKNKQAVVDYLKKVTQQDPNTIKALTKRHYEKLKDPNYRVTRPQYVDLINAAIDEGSNIDNTKLGKSLTGSGVGNQVSLHTFLTTNFLTNLGTTQVNEAFGATVEFTKSDPVAAQQTELNKEKKELEAAQSTAITNIQYVNNIKRPYFYKDDWKTELGIIGNIYVNLNFLFRLALDNNLESLDTKEKKDINLYNFLKNVLSEVSSAIGNVSNFDLFVDPEDSKVYIIDVNYVDEKSRAEVYSNIFQLEIHNLASTVRSYKLESQIFPDQSSVVAIGAQVGGGAMATDNNTMLDFNKGLTDRITPKKLDPTTDPNQSTAEEVLSQAQNVTSALQSLYEFFGDLSYGPFTDSDFDADKAGDYKNSLKDLINFFKNLTKSNIKNRAIIPTKLSVTMDGIGGLVIGHLFKIPEPLLPKGYQGGELGSKLAHTITGIGHSIKDNDWTTSIDAQTIILDEPEGGLTFEELVKINPKTGKTETEGRGTVEERKRSGGNRVSPDDKPRKKGKCDKLLKIVTQANAPGLNIPDRTPWATIKNQFPIINGPVPIKAVGTPFDSGNDFAYKMGSIKVSKAPSRKINYIVLHYTVSSKIDPLHHYRTTWEGREASSDFTIGRNGHIAGFKNFRNFRSWHYGDPSWGTGMNTESIGFEIESYGPAYYCLSTGKFLNAYDQELDKSEVALTPTYRGSNLWHALTNVQVSAIANLIISLYNSGAISDKVQFLRGVKSTGRYDILFPETGYTSKPPSGIVTHGTGQPPSRKIDIFPQGNLRQMLDDLPNLIANNNKTSINWIQ